ALGRRIRQPDARAVWPISPCDRASDHQPRGLIEFLVGQHQRRTVLCLLTPCLRLEIDPGEITAAGQVRQLRHYQTSLPTGRPQSTSPGWSSAVKPFSTSLSVIRRFLWGSITSRLSSILISTFDPSARPSCSRSGLGTRSPTLLPQRCSVTD